MEAQDIFDAEGDKDGNEDNIIREGELDDLASRLRLSQVKLCDGKNGTRKRVYYGAETGEGPWYEILFCTILSVELEDGYLSKLKPFIMPRPRSKFNERDYKERINHTEYSSRQFTMREETKHIMLDWLDLACRRNIGKGYILDRPGEKEDSSRAPQWYIKNGRPMLVGSDATNASKPWW